MNKELVGLLEKYYKNNETADEQFLYEVKDIINNSDKTKNIIDNISLINTKEIAFYKSEENSICFNKDLNKLLSFYSDEYLKQKSEDRYLFNNLTVINVFLHELDHAILFNDINKGNNDLMVKLSLVCDILGDIDSYDSATSFSEIINNLKEFFKKYKYYNKYHDYVPFETRAIINSLYQIIGLIKELNNSDIDSKHIKYNDNKFNDLINFEILDRYSNFNNGISNSLSYDYCNLFNFREAYFPDELILYNTSHEKSYIADSKKYSFKERVALGLQVSAYEINDNIDLEKYKTITSHEKKKIISFGSLKKKQ
jgi:hypothetical protein